MPANNQSKPLRTRKAHVRRVLSTASTVGRESRGALSSRRIETVARSFARMIGNAGVLVAVGALSVDEYEHAIATLDVWVCTLTQAQRRAALSVLAERGMHP